MQPSEDQIKSSTPVSVKSVENNPVETRSQDEDTWTKHWILLQMKRLKHGSSGRIRCWKKITHVT